MDSFFDFFSKRCKDIPIVNSLLKWDTNSPLNKVNTDKYPYFCALYLTIYSKINILDVFSSLRIDKKEGSSTNSLTKD